MSAVIQPKAWHRRWINEAVRAEINLCFTCGSCAVECPVNRATGGLDPRRLVWMANLGLMEDLLRLPDLWLCLECRKCSHVCPMTVKPSALIAFLRWEAVREGGGFCGLVRSKTPSARTSVSGACRCGAGSA